MAFYTLRNCFRKLLLHFFLLFHIKKFSRNFTYFLGTGNLRNNSLLVRTISIACMIFCQTHCSQFNFHWVSSRKLLWTFLQNSRGYTWRIYFLVKFHGEVCLPACLNRIKIWIGKHFSRYFKEILGTHLKTH